MKRSPRSAFTQDPPNAIKLPQAVSSDVLPTNVQSVPREPRRGFFSRWNFFRPQSKAPSSFMQRFRKILKLAGPNSGAPVSETPELLSPEPETSFSASKDPDCVDTPKADATESGIYFSAPIPRGGSDQWYARNKYPSSVADAIDRYERNLPNYSFKAIDPQPLTQQRARPFFAGGIGESDTTISTGSDLPATVYPLVQHEIVVANLPTVKFASVVNVGSDSQGDPSSKSVSEVDIPSQFRHYREYREAQGSEPVIVDVKMKEVNPLPKPPRLNPRPSTEEPEEQLKGASASTGRDAPPPPQDHPKAQGQLDFPEDEQPLQLEDPMPPLVLPELQLPEGYRLVRLAYAVPPTPPPTPEPRRRVQFPEDVGPLPRGNLAPQVEPLAIHERDEILPVEAIVVPMQDVGAAALPENNQDTDDEEQLLPLEEGRLDLPRFERLYRSVIRPSWSDERLVRAITESDEYVGGERGPMCCDKHRKIHAMKIKRSKE